MRWEGRNGKTGYSPARRRIFGIHAQKNSEEPKQYFPLTDQVIQDHLTGKLTAGVYPLLTDETCWFLAADFDKATWQDNVRAFLQTCSEWNVPAALERPRSGRGGHVWIFFETSLPASLARKLGAAILTWTMERRHQLGLNSYDRFFPSQDTMPRGGFGNLIALPLQHMPRGHGNSVFLDLNFNPQPDQWAFLSGIRRMSFAEVESIVRDAERSGDIIGVRRSITDDELADDPWTLSRPRGRKRTNPSATRYHPNPNRSEQFGICRKGRLAASYAESPASSGCVSEPGVLSRADMRLSTFGKPHVIRCAEEFTRHVALPRGCLDETSALFKSHKVAVKLDDRRFAGQPIDTVFRGQLRPEQQAAADALLAHDDGILCATTAFGKTVVTAWLIAARKVNTLVLVHLRQLLDQWRERLATFLNFPSRVLVKSVVDAGVPVESSMSPSSKV